MAVDEKLGEHAREGSAGASAYRGFTYQHHWSLCKLLEVHEEESDYIVLVDHHDDFIVWKAPPQGLIRCFQIKGKARGNWTTAALLKRKGGGLSIMGKLYHHRLFFQDSVEALEFISNARFSVGRLSDGSDPLSRLRIACTELETATADKIRACLREEHGLSHDPDFEDLVFLEKTSMPLEAFREHTLGRVADVLEKASGGQPVRSKAAYQALMDEIQRRASLVATEFPAQEALRRKSLDRETVQEMFADILAPPAEELWPLIVAGLLSEGYGPVRISKVRTAHVTLAARRTAPEWRFVDDLVEQAREIVLSLDEAANLEECLAEVIPELKRHDSAASLSDLELRALVMEAVFHG